MIPNRVQRIFVIRPVEMRLYTYNGERIRNVPEDYIIDQEVTVQEAMNTLRSLRNMLLQNCDWTQLEDVPFTDSEKNAWRTYRQNLRDFPSLVNMVDWTAPDWPLAPGETVIVSDEVIYDWPPQNDNVALPENETIEEPIVHSVIVEQEEIIVEDVIVEETIADSLIGEQMSIPTNDIYKNPDIMTYEYVEGFGVIPITDINYPRTPESEL
jgi:hypothetical protein